MRRNHFIFPYTGTKLQERDNILEPLLNIINQNDITTIVEPFTGSSSLSYMLYKYIPNKKFRYILCDTDKKLMNLYNILRTSSEEELKQIEQEYAAIVRTFKTREQYITYIKQEGLMQYLVKNNFHSINAGRFPLQKLNNFNLAIYRLNILNSGIYDFIRNNDIEFINGNGIPLIDRFKNDSKTLIINDPPYINLCNSLYEYKDGGDIYQYVYNNDLSGYKCHIVFILQKMWIINLLFSKWNTIHTYNKMYNITKKRVEHVIIYNH